MAPRRKVLQTNFIAGELAPELAMRLDTAQYAAGARSAENTRILVGGGAKRRPGSWWRQQATADGLLVDFVVNQSTKYLLVFTAQRMDAYRVATDGTLTGAGGLTGCPWTLADVFAMDWAQDGNTILLTHPNFLQMVTRLGATTWSRQQFPWHTLPSGRILQPHAKLAANNVTIQPSGTGGGIIVTASTAYWQNGHVGQRIRFLDRDILIDSLATPAPALIVNATVIEALRPTQQLTVGSTGNFNVDDVVTGSTSGAKGVIAGINTGTIMTVAITKGVTPFTAETIAGPSGSSTISAAVTIAPVALRDWTEQLYNTLNGFPRAVEIHRGRILFAGSAALPSGLAGSSPGNIFDFDVGDGSDADGFLETIGDSAAVGIVRMHSAEQLLLFTDKGPYYVPESLANPFKPSSLAFNHFGGDWPCSAVPTGDFDGGVIFVSSSVIVKCAPTGNVNNLWQAKEVSMLSPHLVASPANAAYSTNFLNKPERYGFAVNADGSLAVMMLMADEQIRNVVPWTTNGAVRSLCNINPGQVYALVRRTVNGQTIYIIEQYDDALTLDAATSYANLADLVARYGSSTVNVVAPGPFHLGTYPLAVDPVPAGPYTVGFFYDIDLETLPPNIDDREGPHAGDLMRIVEATVHVVGSQRFAANGYELSAYQIEDALSVAPPVKNGPQRFDFLGWKREPTIRITQPDPLPLTVLGIKSRVAYS